MENSKTSKIIKIPQTCCIISPHSAWAGFKDEKSPDFLRLKACIRKKIISLIEEHAVRCFISGMSRGLELLAAETVISLRKKYGLTFKGVIPYEEHTSRWPVKYHEKYYKIMAKSDSEIMIEKYYTPGCYKLRDKYMMEKSNYMLTGNKQSLIIKEKDYLNQIFMSIEKVSLRPSDDIFIIDDTTYFISDLPKKIQESLLKYIKSPEHSPRKR